MTEHDNPPGDPGGDDLTVDALREQRRRRHELPAHLRRPGRDLDDAPPADDDVVGQAVAARRAARGV